VLLELVGAAPPFDLAVLDVGALSTIPDLAMPAGPVVTVLPAFRPTVGDGVGVVRSAKRDVCLSVGIEFRRTKLVSLDA